VAWRERMQRAPWWVWSLQLGGIFALFRFLWDLLIGDASVPLALVSGLVGGAFFGLIFGPLSARMARRQRNAMGQVSDEEARVVQRAAVRGPLPTDPRLRNAAAGAATNQLEQLRRQRYWAPVFWLLVIALTLWLAVTDSPWWGLLCVFFAGFLVVQLWMPRHLSRRVARLRGEAPAHGPDHAEPDEQG
jgi:hypothetical protein